MWRFVLLILPLILSTLAIKVPVDNNEESNAENITSNDVANKKQDTFYVSDQIKIDSYLIPPDPYSPEQVYPDIVVTPATYLLPPSPEKQVDYYAPTEAGEQSDWYPIPQAPLPSTPVELLPPVQSHKIPVLIADNQTYNNNRGAKVYNGEHIILLPSIQLEPPSRNAPDDYKITNPSEQFEQPSEDENHQYDTIPYVEYEVPQIQKSIPRRNRKLKNSKNNIPHPRPAEPALALHLTPPKPVATKYKNPTKLYPKKVSNGFQPIPIPIAQFADDTFPDVPRAKPAKPLKPVGSIDTEYFTPDEKKKYQFEQAEKKRKLKGELEAAKQQQLAAAAEDTYGDNAPTEQETSETNYGHPGRNAHPARLRQERPAPPRPAPQTNAAAPPPGDRTEFRMHGMKGPHSYQFGFDTGKGKNRQFRYEERDNDGRVRGHYGYVDKRGKLRVVNYDADPQTGFHVEAPTENE